MLWLAFTVINVTNELKRGKTITKVANDKSWKKSKYPQLTLKQIIVKKISLPNMWK